SAVQAMKAGAMEYITKPFDLDEMEVQLDRAFNQYQMNRKIQLIEDEREKEKQSIITENEEMLKVLEDVKRLAALDDVTVLITGETGTGKELIADYIFS
ncbi:sigma-54-dependent Fis family transcriptional regulator, partial [Aduncisulcus paluster]